MYKRQVLLRVRAVHPLVAAGVLQELLVVGERDGGRDEARQHQRGHEYASYIFDAVLNGTPFIFGGNVLNTGLIPNLPEGCCVEVKCVADRNGITPTYAGNLPPQCAALTRTNVNVQEMVIEAALTRTRARDPGAEAAIGVANGMALLIPDFLWGLVLVLLFGVLWPVFHISGRVTPSLDPPFTTNFYAFEALVRLRFDLWADIINYRFLPSLATPLAAIIGQLLKQSLKETMHLDYVTLARTKGFGENQVILR